MDQSRISSARASVSSVEEKLSTASSGDSTGSLPPSEAERLSSLRAEKALAIRRACTSRNLDALVVHATSEGGLLHDELRQIAWPLLLQCGDNTRHDDLKPLDELPRHVDEDQVQLDVDRSFVYYPSAPEDEISTKKEQLSALIRQVIRNYPMLCYFQGYHDIVQVLLLVLGTQKAASAMAQISLFRIRDYMLPSLSPAIKHLQLIPAIIETADPKLRQHLASIQPFFALAATLTLYAHDIQEYSDIARLFDFILAKEPVVTIYLFAAIILSRKKELLEIPTEEPEMLHFTLSKLPSLPGPPPESLPFGAWKQIPRCSVLKTSRDPFQTCTVDEAVQLFHQQARQIRREEWRKQALEFTWNHRRSIGSVALAVVVGAASIYIRKKGLDASIWSVLGRLQAFWRG
ncbi:hypothetical protein N7510_010844 [Penicillium lagena]|uniref:uncharacterized protein n=1 Tax=Penicillium lagena TaxID=94218 RepID=UPI002541DBD7|nr:uncharacterized protein N7510_010844 [Penicillium lagena]KAJ5601310.1 hypothetical protein N7510_010844 [Penicillium lagena]